MACDTAKAQDNACMLDRIVRVIKLRSHSRHVFLLAVLKHFFHPVRCQDLHIVVQEKEVFALRFLRSEIVDRGIVEFFFPGQYPRLRITVREFFVIFKGFFLLAVVLYDQDLIIAIC